MLAQQFGLPLLFRYLNYLFIKFFHLKLTSPEPQYGFSPELDFLLKLKNLRSF